MRHDSARIKRPAWLKAWRVFVFVPSDAPVFLVSGQFLAARTGCTAALSAWPVYGWFAASTETSPESFLSISPLIDANRAIPFFDTAVSATGFTLNGFISFPLALTS